MEFDRSSYYKLMMRQNWDALRVMLLEKAYKYYLDKLPDPVEREEFVSRAIEAVFMGDQPWDPDKGSLEVRLDQVL